MSKRIKVIMIGCIIILVAIVLWVREQPRRVVLVILDHTIDRGFRLDKAMMRDGIPPKPDVVHDGFEAELFSSWGIPLGRVPFQIHHDTSIEVFGDKNISHQPQHITTAAAFLYFPLPPLVTPATIVVRDPKKDRDVFSYDLQDKLTKQGGKP